MTTTMPTPTNTVPPWWQATNTNVTANYIAVCNGNSPGEVYQFNGGGGGGYLTPEDACLSESQSYGCGSGNFPTGMPTGGDFIDTGYACPANPTGEFLYQNTMAPDQTAPVNTVNFNADGSLPSPVHLMMAGFGGGKAMSLNTTQIALIILLVLLLSGTGAFLLFRHMKK